jgi:hypothetical protein
MPEFGAGHVPGVKSQEPKLIAKSKAEPLPPSVDDGQSTLAVST